MFTRFGLVMAAVVAASCGGGGSTPTSSTAPAPGGSSSCVFTVPPIGDTISPDAQSIAFRVTVVSGTNCSWTASSTSSFLTVSGATSGIGAATVLVQVAENSGPERSGAVSIAGLTLTVSQAAQRVPIIDVTTILDGTSNACPGQSFTTPAGNGYRFIWFNWYSFERAPIAFASLMLMNREYLGSPYDLTAATAGVIARSEQTSPDHYNFSKDVVLTGSTTYWVYTTDRGGTFSGSGSLDAGVGGYAYVSECSGTAKINYERVLVFDTRALKPVPGAYTDWDFRLTGSPR